MNLTDTQSLTTGTYADTAVMMSLGYHKTFQNGTNCFEDGDYDNAITHFLEALDLTVEHRRKDFQLLCHDQLSHCYFRKYEFDSMLNHATEAYRLSRVLESSDLKVTALNRIGIAYGSFGINEEALKYFLESVALAEKNNHQDLSIIYNNISVIYHHLGNLYGSLPYLEKGLELAIKSDQKSHQLTCLCNFGERYTELGRYKEALQYLRQALTLVKTFDESNIIIVTIYENIGDCLYQQEKLELAIKSYHMGLRELQLRPNNHLKSEILFSLSKAYTKRGELAVAAKHLEIALSCANTSNNLKTKFAIHKALSDIYKSSGDFKKALYHFEDFHNTREMVHDEDAKNRLQGMMLKFDVERVQKEKELAEKEQELAELKYVELAELNEKLDKLSKLDSLTQVSNRRHLNDYLSSEYFKAKELYRSISVIMCDVDFFKRINDKYSHAVGDSVLVSIAKLFKENMRQDDLVARYGGEEFAIVFPQVKLPNAIKIAEKLRSLVEQYPWHTIQEGLKVTISIGVASGTKFPTYEKLLAQADAKLYEAKENGRNQVKH